MDRGVTTSPSEHFSIDVAALELKITNVVFDEPLCGVDFRGRIAGRDAQNSAALVGGLRADAGNVEPEHLKGVRETQGFQHGNEVLLGPIVGYWREVVDLLLSREKVEFSLDSFLVAKRARL